ncbi:unnamed protein product [Schistosoma mattheei]|uniref:Uncharacterized protein n=1 Tax=Schistosoma mattheei TaxID=31246 RepID=A0A3P8KX49_9TREM|nr:unnamed protein product [Schistosoma mattheei]
MCNAENMWPNYVISQTEKFLRHELKKYEEIMRDQRKNLNQNK